MAVRRKVKLTICYDGADYYGWQIQPELPTIQGVLRETIEDIVGHKVNPVGASRTDAGVSALGQVVLIETNTKIPTENLAKVITGRLPQDIAVCKAEDVGDNFDPINSVTSKLYRYSIFTGKIRPVMHIRHCWHVPRELDVKEMKRAGKNIKGRRDFKSFATANDKRKSSVRTVMKCEVRSENEWIYVDCEGDGFLYNMVRNIVGTLVDVGSGRISAEKIDEIIGARDRRAAGGIAPANGLCLMWIKY